MPVETPIQSVNLDEEALPEYQMERYWALWQYPEGRYAYMIGWRCEAWLLVFDSEEAGGGYLHSDAIHNRRGPELYRLDELTLPEAFDAARSQPTPFISSMGTPVKTVKGVQVRTDGRLFGRSRNIPL